jgi:hypothetical protein
MFKHVTALALIAGTASSAFAALTPELILRRFDPVPGVPGEFFPASSFDAPSINNNGEVIFSGIMDTSGVGTAVT